MSDDLLTRRLFLRGLGGAALSLGAGAFLGCRPGASRNNGVADAGLADALVDASGDAGATSVFRFAVIADSHIIDEYYEGPESNALDTESILKANQRFEHAANKLNTLNDEMEPGLDMVFHLGDLIHEFAMDDPQFVMNNRTSVDIAAEMFDSLDMPLHYCLGNHDYDLDVGLDFTHGLFPEVFGGDVYYSVDHRGWKFVMLNNFLGASWEPNSDVFDTDLGTLGEEQLQWFEGELQQGMPTMVFVHFPLAMISDDEFGDFNAQTLIRQYSDTISTVITGHWHRWMDFGTTFGPRHFAMGSTRYDRDAYIIAEVDLATDELSFLNENLWEWRDISSEPYSVG